VSRGRAGFDTPSEGPEGDPALDFLTHLPTLTSFALTLMLTLVLPGVMGWLRLPRPIGYILAGVILGPNVLAVLNPDGKVVTFFAELGKLLLMFFAGLEIDLALFSKSKNKSYLFGLITTTVPLLLGTAVALLFHYSIVPAIVIGSLLASHTLLSLPIIIRLGESQLEPVMITVGATVVSDTLSLVIFAICLSIFQTGFSAGAICFQILEIAIFVPFILIGVSRLGARLLRKVENDESTYFVVMLAILAAGVIAQAINLPGIVGAFLAGLAVNAAVQRKPANE